MTSSISDNSCTGMSLHPFVALRVYAVMDVEPSKRLSVCQLNIRRRLKSRGSGCDCRDRSFKLLMLCTVIMSTKNLPLSPRERC